MKKWGLVDDYYFILADSNGDQILDEIIKHFEENNPNPGNKKLIIDPSTVEQDPKEALKFQRRVDHYCELGYVILLTLN